LPRRGGRSNPNEVVERPYCHFTVNTTSKLKLRTKNASASSYYGVMFSVTALRRPIRITQLHMASGAWRRELYRVPPTLTGGPHRRFYVPRFTRQRGRI
jgi:hypothetical protein